MTVTNLIYHSLFKRNNNEGVFSDTAVTVGKSPQPEIWPPAAPEKRLPGEGEGEVNLSQIVRIDLILRIEFLLLRRSKPLSHKGWWDFDGHNFNDFQRLAKFKEQG